MATTTDPQIDTVVLANKSSDLLRYRELFHSEGIYSVETTSVDKAQELMYSGNNNCIIISPYSSTSESIRKKIKSANPHARIVLIKSPNRKTQALGTKEVSFDENESEKSLRERLGIDTPEISWEKQALIERMACQAAFRLEEALWSSYPKLTSEKLHRTPTDIADGKLAGGNQDPIGYAELSETLPGILDKRSTCEKLIRGLVVDVQNTFWVEVRTNLIDRRRCDYSPWLTFFVTGSGKDLDVTLSGDNSKLLFNLGTVEAGADHVIRAVADIVKSDLPPLKPILEWGKIQNSHDLFTRCLSVFLKRYIKEIVQYGLQSRGDLNHSSPMATCGRFGIQAKGIGYSAFLGLIYALRATLYILKSIKFEGNGTFRLHGKQIEFHAASAMLDLIASNILPFDTWNSKGIDAFARKPSDALGIE